MLNLQHLNLEMDYKLQSVHISIQLVLDHIPKHPLAQPEVSSTNSDFGKQQEQQKKLEDTGTHKLAAEQTPTMQTPILVSTINLTKVL